MRLQGCSPHRPWRFQTGKGAAFCLGLLLLCLPAPALAQIRTASVITDSVMVMPLPHGSDPWFGRDKVDHLTVSAVLLAAQYYVWHRERGHSSRRSLQAASLGTLLLGVTKEVYDATTRRRRASVKDLTADLLGVALTVFLIHK
ncbi:MAG: VanZ family protein [candidate division KSB1 bacterium]|nr:VanZ family protein [candidate division KSB1 bacterium]MDZ7276030.1 VanZ family protein [candidate division KSB1 bacterium]MDZ7285688.1 VanZ family protein [candidate division KSB1 bacterium]MDZ7298720.1 VanZ family protein [candidate division KSB1 bacterium]MDZ7309521.1 VanZ family protein [candidate division KSB1 bacterium]